MGLIGDIKDAASIVQKADNIELYQKILDIQASALELQEENINLKNKVRELEKRKNIEDSLEFRENAYYKKLEDNKEDGPFCSACWDKDKRLTRMHSINDGTVVKFACSVCNCRVYEDGEACWGI
ncbi:MAG TPA: hypothetical protein DCP90_05785 [Clostridiales bacterium]|nr:MAG: hypothetical protein A2Y22_04890 [Clostridiales bacterium GWD2_32_59]HAN10104.1 hypothetical protein [Clostridiales bacterium]